MAAQKYGTGIRWILYIVSFLFSLLGIIIGIVLMTRGDAESKTVGKNCIIAAIIAIVLVCVCYLISMVMGIGAAAVTPSSMLLLPII
jgi:uncharacterized membrane protein YozB (DUF420 family)